MSNSIQFGQLPRDVRQSVFEFAGHPTALVAVSKSWAGMLHNDTLEDFCFRETPAPFIPLRKAVAAERPRNYFVFFHRMNNRLSKQLHELDPELRWEIFQKFKGSLSPERTIALHEEVVSIRCILSVWKRIQSQAKEDLPEQLRTPKEMRQLLQDEGSLWRFKMVATLDLSRQNLSRIPQELFSLHHLSTLDLSNNQLTDLPKSFYSTFAQLQQLDLTNNPLDPNKYLEIATRLSEMNNLGVLKFDVPAFNIILQHAIQERSALYKVWRTLCNTTPSLPELGTIAEIREAFRSKACQQELLKIDSLDLSGCELTLLPSEIFELRNLEVLDLSFNPFTVLPSTIKQLAKLETLDLSSTHIPRGVYKPVSEMLRECPSLRVVRHHDQDFRFRPKRELAVHPQPLSPSASPPNPRAAWQARPPAQSKFRCAIL